MQNAIQLIVGLGNPGHDYESTRHNVGAWFVEQIAEEHSISLKPETKFLGKTARIQAGGQDYWLLVPTTFMNRSGLAVKSMAHFYKIPPEAILIVHDDLDFPPGIARLKQDGGHGGHNGLRDIIQHLQSKNFHRLRIGIGHPGQRDEVVDYVLHPPSKKEQQLILDSISSARVILPNLVQGNFQQAIQQLHNS